MRKHNRIYKKLATAIVTGGLLLQIGPCTGDSVRDALGSGARATLNGLFDVITNSLVSNVLNLP